MSRRWTLLAIVALLAVFTISACDSGEAQAAPGAYTVSAADAVSMIESGERTVIDVRRPDEFEQAHVVGAVNINLEGPDFADRIAELDVEEPYLVYCRSGNRSALAAAQMAEAGIKDIADAGGLVGLAQAGAPVE
jgi:rhodanese-related sulfurtransferase